MANLTVKAIKALRPREKPYKAFDTGNLYLAVNPNGSRWWRVRYWLAGREKLLSVGTFPAVSLDEARDRCETILRDVKRGVDPSAQRKAVKQTQAKENSFGAIADEWLAKQRHRWTESSYTTRKRRLERPELRDIRAMPVMSVTSRDLLMALRKIETHGTHETAHRVLGLCFSVFAYAIASGRATNNPAAGLTKALTPVKTNHRAAILDAKEYGKLLAAIDGYDGSYLVREALKVLALTFVRPGELRNAEWREFDLDEKMWRIPAVRMKMKKDHVVPLSKQAVEVLRDVHKLTGRGRYVFPGARSDTRPLSENALTAALRYMGYGKDQVSAHGFRASARTLLAEMGWRSEVLERQLAHVEQNKVKAAYNRAEHLPERVKLMQEWADYCDSLREGKNSNVTPLRKKRA